MATDTISGADVATSEKVQSVLRSRREVMRRIADVALIRQQGLTSEALMRRSMARLRGLVPFEECFVWSTDPMNGLPTAELMSDGRTREAHLASLVSYCVASEDDENGEDGLARSARRAVRRSGDGRTLRLAFVTGTLVWARGEIVRTGQMFTQHDVAIVAKLIPAIAEGLRMAAAPASPACETEVEPGFMVIAGHPTLQVSSRCGAQLTSRLCTNGEVPFAVEAAACAARLRQRNVRSRMRLDDGQWVALLVSPLNRSEAGEAYAVMIEPASPREMAPIQLEALGFSAREQDIAALIAQGASTNEIASSLFLSPHTVRDHLKAMFRKLRVSSRGELVAVLLAQAPIHAG